MSLKIPLPIHAIILAAGQGTRMRSDLPKVLQSVGGRPMLGHVLQLAAALQVQGQHVVVGHKAAQVRGWAEAAGEVAQLHWAVQSEQLGTAHAVAQALPQIPDEAIVIVLYADVPLIRPQTLMPLLEAATHGLAVLTVRVPQPAGYGRIVRDRHGAVQAIVEDKDASDAQRLIDEINTGVIAAPAASLKRWVAAIGNDNAKGEYYLTDAVALSVAEGRAVQAVIATDPDEVEGVNDRVQLARSERIFQRREAERLMRDGLCLLDPARFDLRGTLRHGRDVTLDVGVIIEGEVELGDGVSVGAYTRLKNVRIGAGTRIDSHCILESSQVGSACVIGPYARIRPDSQVEDEAHVGNFVELKKAHLGRGSKANHLSYLGDAVIGAGVNIGAGTITCNYDGANKSVTTIGDGAFIGSNSALVAPVTIGAQATIAAGSVITRDAPADALTVARAREQRSVAGWKRPVKKKAP